MTAASPRGAAFAAGDPLRALAALTVLLYHAALLGDPARDDGNFTARFGDVAGTILRECGGGLYVFFALSGYLIAGPFVRAFVLRGPLPAIRPYLRNRVLRIVPAFWVAVTITLLVAGVDGRPLGDILAVYAFAQALHPSETADLITQAWTLGIELSFYVLVPFVAALAVAALARRVPAPLARRVLLVVVVAVAAAVSLYAQQRGHIRDRTILSFFYAFVPGIVLAAVEPLEARRPGGERAGAVVCAGLAVAGAVIWLAALGPAGFSQAAGCGLLVAAPLLYQRAWGRVWRPFDVRPLHWLGLWSYSFYLAHWGILLLLYEHLGGGSEEASFLILLAVAFPIIVVVSAAGFQLVERPFLRRREAWRRGRGPRRTYDSPSAEDLSPVR